MSTKKSKIAVQTKIRRLTIADYGDLIRLWRSSGLPFKPRGRDSKPAIAKQMNTNPDFFLGAFMDQKLIGAAVLSSDLRKGWINRLAVNPERRRRGVATALIEESEKILRKKGLRIFCCLIEGSNAASKALFKSCSYSEYTDISYFTKRDSDAA
jgi:ribosomal protein S18 acetylase RimI-like enzyme